jgi:hypothetical protein
VTPKVYYYGCMDRPGHHLYLPTTTPDESVLRSNPWKYDVDGGLAPTGPQIEGLASVHHRRGWTALSFWDRSVDHRPGSCSTLLARGDWDFSQMLELFQTHFPQVVSRFKFEIRELSRRN